MVYGGRPSRGCRTCRARRIKCDEGKPTCRQCAKSKRECGGYRSEFEIVHRDQTRSTVRRIRRSHDVQQAPPIASPSIVFVNEYPQLPSPRPTPPRQEPHQRHPGYTSSPPPVLTLPVAQRAACYFASNFILVPKGFTPHGYMDYLVPLVESARPDSALSYAFNACAFAALGNRVRADNVDFASLALKQHTLALTRTHVALGDPKTANTDATLAAVLLLSMYEGITAILPTRMLAWRSHIDGAVDIVRVRGRAEMCKTKIGSHLFHGVRQQLISRTLSAGIAPPGGADWWEDAENASLISTCQQFALKTGELRVQTSALLAQSKRDPKHMELVADMAKRVQELDHRVAAWLMSMPPAFRFRTLCWVDEHIGDVHSFDRLSEAEVFPGRVDIYPDFVTAGAWNTARATRLILASLTIRITAWLRAPLDYRTTVEYAMAKQICEGTISEAIASVPYHLGWHTRQRELFQQNPELSGFVCGEEAPSKALPAYMVVWTLACLRNHDMTTEDQRAWVNGRLKFIEEKMGIKYARIIARVNIRFPSMLILQDGRMRFPDVLVNKKLDKSTASECIPPIHDAESSPNWRPSPNSSDTGS